MAAFLRQVQRWLSYEQLTDHKKVTQITPRYSADKQTKQQKLQWLLKKAACSHFLWTGVPAFHLCG